MTNTTAYLATVNLELAVDYLETELGFSRSCNSIDSNARWAWEIDDAAWERIDGPAPVHGYLV